MTIITNLTDIPILPGLHVEVIENPAMTNKVTVVTCNETAVEEAFKLISIQQRIIDGKEHTKIVYMNNYKSVA